MVTGGSCGARPPSCSVVRVAPARRCGFAGAGPAAVARIAPPFPLRGGRPPGPGGAEGRACGSPAAVGAGGGGGWGGRLLARPRVCAEGGWVGGGPLVPWRCLSSAVGGGGGGGMAALVPGASHRPGGRALHPPPLSRAGCPRRPSPGPSPPRPLPRGAGRPGVAVGVSGQWLAGCGAAGSSPRLSPPHSLPREAARPRTSCHTVGGAWVRGPIPPPNPPVPAVWAFTCAAACVGAGAAAAAGCAGGSASGRGRYAKPGGASCWRPHP